PYVPPSPASYLLLLSTAPRRACTLPAAAPPDAAIAGAVHGGAAVKYRHHRIAGSHGNDLLHHIATCIDARRMTAAAQIQPVGAPIDRAAICEYGIDAGACRSETGYLQHSRGGGPCLAATAEVPTVCTVRDRS